MGFWDFNGRQGISQQWWPKAIIPAAIIISIRGNKLFPRSILTNCAFVTILTSCYLVIRAGVYIAASGCYCIYITRARARTIEPEQRTIGPEQRSCFATIGPEQRSCFGHQVMAEGHYSCSCFGHQVMAEGHYSCSCNNITNGLRPLMF